jgi:hypothetical protein
LGDHARSKILQSNTRAKFILLAKTYRCPI